MDLNLGKVDNASLYDQALIECLLTIQKTEDFAHCGDDYSLKNVKNRYPFIGNALSVTEGIMHIYDEFKYYLIQLHGIQCLLVQESA